MIGVTRSLTRLKTDHRDIGILFSDSIRNYMTKQLSNDRMIEKEPGQGEPLVVGYACVCCQAMPPSHWQEGHHLQAGIQAILLSFLISTDTNLSLQLGSGGFGERRSRPPPHCHGRGCLVRSNNHEESHG